jgi:hypothetical protein
MPTIDLGHWTPERTSQAMDILWPIMIFPASPARREEYQAIKLAQRYAHGLASIDTHPAMLIPAFFSQILQPLKRGPSYWKMRGHAMIRGHIAGQLLILIKQMDEAGYGGSITKAIPVYVEYAKTKSERSRFIPASDNSFWKPIWSAYQSVAHLWAAVQLLRGKDPLQLLRAKVIPEWRGLASPEGFSVFLAYAKHWWHFGINHIAAHQPGPPMPTLSKQETWTVPPGFPPDTVDFPVPALPDELRQISNTRPWKDRY